MFSSQICDIPSQKIVYVTKILRVCFLSVSIMTC